MVFRRLHQRFPRLALGFLALLLGLSLMWTGCSGGNDGGNEATFTATLPANGISGQGAISGAFSAPSTAITGATVTVSN